jgi:hypothetical protein
MSELVLVTPVTDAELSAYREAFAAVGENLRRAAVPALRIVVVQTRRAAGNLDLEFLRAPDVEVVTTSRFSASAARNFGIARLDRDAHRYVCFLDADAVPSVGLLRAVRGRLHEDAGILVGRPCWHEGPPPAGSSDGEPASARVPIARVPLSAYLWTTFFPVAHVCGSRARFDESIGPGQGTRLKSGEDVLFFVRVVIANDVTHALRFDAHTFHPARPPDFSKHLAYAEGQGSLFVRLLKTRMRRSLKVAVLASFGLFLANGLVRVLTFRRRSALILGLRLRGAWRGLGEPG